MCYWKTHISRTLVWPPVNSILAWGLKVLHPDFLVSSLTFIKTIIINQGITDPQPTRSSTSVPYLHCWPTQFQSDCISFLWLLEQLTTKWVAENKINLFFPSSRVQKSELSITELKSRCWQAALLLKALRDDLCSSQLLVVAGILGWWPHCPVSASVFTLHFPLCVQVSLSFLL